MNNGTIPEMSGRTFSSAPFDPPAVVHYERLKELSLFHLLFRSFGRWTRSRDQNGKKICNVPFVFPSALGRIASGKRAARCLPVLLIE